MDKYKYFGLNLFSAAVSVGLAMPFVTALGIFAAISNVLFLSSCTTMPDSSGATFGHRLPATLKMNNDAGRLQDIYVMVELENGEELPFVLDTGTAFTAFDQTLEPRLGKRLGEVPLWFWGVKYTGGIYVAPKLYLGGSLLQITGTNIATVDCKSMSSSAGRPVMGVLGMDVLEHYCIQLDFAARRIRFLDDRYAKKKDWGEAFSLGPDGGNLFISENLVSRRASPSLIDTGDNGDGWLTPSLFQQWTNQAILPADGQVRSSNGRLGGESYSEVDLRREALPYNGIGLRFLSRHLVTLDFPNRTLYLKRTSFGPLSLDLKDATEVGKSGATVLKSLIKKGHLPGWSKDDKMATKKVSFRYLSTVSGSFALQKKDDLSVYHFEIVRASENKPWKLQKAWRTDANGRTIEGYLVDEVQ